MSFADAVAATAANGTVLVADGGLATELERRGHDLSDALWSARLLLDAPDEIVSTHLAYFRAGAMIATTASYQASFAGFERIGLDRTEASRLMQRSVALAQRARTEIRGGSGERWVAASVGPYGATLADGSEYRGRYGLTIAALEAWHRPRLEVLAEAEPDVLAVETIPDVDEAEAVVAALHGLEVPAWLSFSIDGGLTRAGQPLAEAFAVAAATPEVMAIGVNCCHPEDVPAAIATARSVTDKPIIAYPNSGEGWDAVNRRWTGLSHFSAQTVRSWAQAGAHILGGCCRTGPNDIERVLSLSKGQGVGAGKRDVS